MTQEEVKPGKSRQQAAMTYIISLLIARFFKVPLYTTWILFS